MRAIAFATALLGAVLLSSATSFADDPEPAAPAPPPAAASAEPSAKEVAPPPAAAEPGKADAKHEAKADEDEIPDAHEATTVTIDIDVESLSKFELGPGTVNAEFIVTLTCDHAPCNPQLAIGNGKELGKPEKILDKPLHKRLRMKAELDAYIDLSEYPFDSHTLAIELYEKKDPLQIKLKAGEVKLNDRLRLPGWDFGESHAAIEPLDAGEKEKQDQFVLNMDVSRPKLPQTFKSLVPVFFMLLVAAVGLFLRPKSIGPRFAASTGGLVPLVMFHVGQISSLPAIGYLTRFDKLMVAAYLAFVVHITLNTLILRSEEVKAEDQSKKLHNLAAILVPAFAIVSWVVVLSRVV